jgi:hypothetical protein
MIALQLGIAATGNYGFFNLLTIALYLAVLDNYPSQAVWDGPPSTQHASGRECGTRLSDAVAPLRQRRRRRDRRAQHDDVFREIDPDVEAAITARAPLVAAGAVVGRAARFSQRLRLFRVMTTERPEIVIEVSEDGVTWKEQEFRWKPGDLKRRPPFVEPHMPRLDWQMWFAALDPASAQEWLRPLLDSAAAGKPVVTAARTESAERHAAICADLRTTEYHFTSRQERAETGAWWKREFVGY